MPESPEEIPAPYPSLNSRPKMSIEELRKRGFIFNTRGKDFILYGGLITMSHEAGIDRIITERISYDAATSTVVYRSVGTFKTGEIFSGHGSSSPANLSGMVKNFPEVMAETRATARMLRVALNIGDLTSFEELGDEDSGPKQERKPATRQQPPLTVVASDDPDQVLHPGTPQMASENQLKKLANGYKKLRDNGGWTETIPDNLTAADATKRIESMIATAVSRGLMQQPAQRESA